MVENLTSEAVYESSESYIESSLNSSTQGNSGISIMSSLTLTKTGLSIYAVNMSFSYK